MIMAETKEVIMCDSYYWASSILSEDNYKI